MDVTAGSPAAVRRAIAADAGEILTLQRAAFLADAQIYGDPFLPSLTQTLDDLRGVITSPTATVLVASIGTRIVGSVRAEVKDGIAYVSRLMTAPDQQGRGVGRQLMHAIESTTDAWS